MARSKRDHASGASSISLFPVGDFAMRRTPFLPYFKEESYGVGANLINERNDFLLAIGKCLSLWPYVEHQMALLLGVLMKAENDATVAVFNAIRTGRSQRDALNAAAQTSLDPPMLRLFEAILSVLQSTGDERADIAHGHWGVLNNHPDKAIWIESKFHSPWNALVLNKQDAGKFSWNHEDLQKHMFVVTVPALEETYERINEIWKILFDFLGLVRGGTAYGIFNKKGHELFQHLCLLPRVAEAIDRQHRRQSEILARLQQQAGPPLA